MIWTLVVNAAIAATQYQRIEVVPEPGWDVRFVCGDESADDSGLVTDAGPVLERTIFRTGSYTCQDTFRAVTFRLTDSKALRAMLPIVVKLSDVPVVNGRQVVNLEHATLIFYEKPCSPPRLWLAVEAAMSGRRCQVGDPSAPPLGVVIPGPSPRRP